MDVKGLPLCVLRGISMKSRIVFVLTLAAFFNPISVFADNTTGEQSKPSTASTIACKDYLVKNLGADQARVVLKNLKTGTTDHSANGS